MDERKRPKTLESHGHPGNVHPHDGLGQCGAGGTRKVAGPGGVLHQRHTGGAGHGQHLVGQQHLAAGAQRLAVQRDELVVEPAPPRLMAMGSAPSRSKRYSWFAASLTDTSLCMMDRLSVLLQ